MGVSCKIVVNTPREGVHRAGQPVAGVVKYAIDEPTVYTDVIISLVGEGRCSWTENDVTASEDGPKTTTYTGTENYVKRRLYMLDKLPGEEITLPFGAYEYPFEFILPRNIPPSFEDSICKISYKVEVKFAKPGFFSINRNFYIEIPVYGHVEHVSPSTPIVFGVDKTLFKPFSNKEQTVRLKAEIDRACLTPGQNANLSFIMTNDTDTEGISVMSELVSTTTYTADCGRQKTYTHSIKETMRGTVCVSIHSVTKLFTVVPILPHLYSIQHSSVLKKSFKLLVTVRLPMPHINASVSVPVVIGEREGAQLCIEPLESEELADQPPSYEDVINEGKV